MLNVLAHCGFDNLCDRTVNVVESANKRMLHDTFLGFFVGVLGQRENQHRTVSHWLYLVDRI